MTRDFTPATLATHWGCSDETVYGLIRAGRLRAWKLGGKLWRIKPEAVEDYECQQAIASEVSPASGLTELATDIAPSTGLTNEARTGFRLARMIEQPQRPRLVHSGQAGA